MSKKIPFRSKLIKELDQIFSVFVRLLSADKEGYITCPLCNTRVHWKNAQNMHFITRSVYKYRWEEVNCNAGCMRCNVILHGNYIIYTRYMKRKHGEAFVDAMISDKSIYKITTPEIMEKIEYYKQAVDQLLKEKRLER